jgi:putative transposase
VLWPEKDGELTAFMRWLTLTHAQRWKHSHGAVGHGHLYQGRFKSFPIEQDEHLLTVLRYVERNPVRAGLVRRAEQWRWGSCHVRQNRSHELYQLLSAWPAPRPSRWLETVNLLQSETEEKMVKESIARNRPVGSDSWTQRVAKELGLEYTPRPRGRPVGWRKKRKSEADETKRTRFDLDFLVWVAVPKWSIFSLTRRCFQNIVRFSGEPVSRPRVRSRRRAG